MDNIANIRLLCKSFFVLANILQRWAILELVVMMARGHDVWGMF